MADFFLPSEKKSPALDSSVTTDFSLPSEAGKTASIGTGEDVARSLGAGAATGLIGLPGIPGSISDLVGLGVRKGGSYLESAVTGKPQTEIEARMLEGERAANERRLVPTLPTSQDVVRAAEKYIPAIKPVTSYDPKTGYGRVAKDTSEAIAGSVVGPGGLLTKLGIGAAGGAAGAGAKEVFRGSGYEAPAQIAGTLLGGGTAALGLGRKAMSAPSAVAERGERVAGQVLRESIDDPAALQATVNAELAAMKADPERYVAGVKPTFAQASGRGDIESLERQIANLAPGSPEAEALAKQIIFSKQALGAEAAKAPGMVSAGIQSPDLRQAFGIQGVNPQGDASRFARATIDALEQRKDNLAKQAWANPAIQNVQVYKNKATGSLDDHLTSLTSVKRSEIPNEIISQIESIKAAPGSVIPLMELQDLRSKVLSQARIEFGRDNNFGGFVNNELGKKIADVINNSKNIRFGDTTGVGRDAWGKAVSATRDYHDTFRPEFMSKLVAETAGGSQKIGGSAVFDTMFSGKNAVENLKEARSALGVDLDRVAGDWLVGKLTNNGTNVKLTQENVRKFLASPTNAGLVDEIPGLRQRMESLARVAGESEQAAALRQVAQGFQSAVNSGNPKTLSNFIAANGAELKASLSSPQEKQFIDAIGRSAKLMQSLPAGAKKSSVTLDRLQNGRMIDIIYGRSAGVISDGIAAELAARTASYATGIPYGGSDILAGLIGAAGGGGKVTGPIAERIGRFVLGDTKEITIEQLQKAARDPEVAMLLMQKPSPESMLRLQDKMANILGPMYYERSLDEPKEKREGRATGGKVSSSSIADKLITAAESAKRMSNKATEPLLRTSDESIARALEIANRHI